MSKIVIEGNINSQNTQIGDNNTLVNINHNTIDWDVLLNELEGLSTQFTKQKKELIQEIKSKDDSHAKRTIKNKFSDYCIGVFSELSSTALIEIMKLFI